MQLSDNKRRALLGIALLATITASVWAQQQEESVVELSDPERLDDLVDKRYLRAPTCLAAPN